VAKTQYEIALILDLHVKEDKLDEKVNGIGSLILENEGEVTKVEKWGKRKLGYRIKSRIEGYSYEGYYAFIKFVGEPKVVLALKKVCKLDEAVLRHLIIKEEKKKSNPIHAIPSAK
jgi:small subunit ribosomal protein S6